MSDVDPKIDSEASGLKRCPITTWLVLALGVVVTTYIMLNSQINIDVDTTRTVMLIALVIVGGVLATVLVSVQGVKNNAAELDRLRAGLERQVSEQTKDIRAARDEAENASRAKSEFLSSMSHELRTPLNAIMGFAQLLDLDNRKKKEDPNYTESVSQILGASAQLLELIEQLLDMSSVETGELKVDLQDVPVERLVAGCLKAAQEKAARMQVNLTCVDDADWTLAMRADEAMVRQALNNILSNAIKYNKVGGTVTVTCDLTEQGNVRLAVRDSGLGIPAAKQSQVFLPFTRLGQEGSAISGTGIGLTLSKKLMTAMGGEIDFASEDGKGSTFWLVLPAAPQYQGEGKKSAPSPCAQKLEGEPFFVLYVEDSPANAALMEHYFAHIENVDLVVAVTGEEGLDIAFERQPSLILMDVNLPGISGAEAMLSVREREGKNAHTPIIALSADAMPEEISKALQAGFDDYLTKPIKLNTLKEKLGQYLEL